VNKGNKIVTAISVIMFLINTILRDIMTSIGFIVIGVLCLFFAVAGICFLFGKGKRISSFYYYLNKDELEKYNIKAFLHYEGIIVIIISLTLFAMFWGKYIDMQIMSITAGVCFLITFVFFYPVDPKKMKFFKNKFLL